MAPKKVFISYSHDSPEHVNRVAGLAASLRRDGVDCRIDQYVDGTPPEGWPLWMEESLDWAEIVLVVSTETYLRRVRKEEPPGKGLGATWEAHLIYQHLYEAHVSNSKFIPVVFEEADKQFIPAPLRSGSHYPLSKQEGYDRLYVTVTGQHTPPPEVGKVKRVGGNQASPLFREPGLEAAGDAAPTPSRIQSPVSFFTGREAVLKELRKALQSHGRAALSGLAGVGKTQTALEYARKHRNRYSRQLWARAETPEGLLSDFAGLARDLDLPEKDEQDLETVASAVKKWLEAATGWLLVLDNADDLPGIRPWLPEGDGHVLLTTRASATGGIAEMVEIREMGQEEGALFLLRRSKRIAKTAKLDAASDSDVETAKEIVKELGGLPLAIDQAGAFIEETRRGLSEYLDLYRAEGARLRARRGRLAADHESVAVTFSLAFGKVEEECKAAADLIRLCAFLAPDDIPEELFTEGAAELGDELAAVASKPLDLAETVEAAGRFSLIRRNPSRRSIDQHRLVQDVVKDGMVEPERRTWAERAVRVVAAAFPDGEYENWSWCERLLPHARIAAELIKRHGFEFVEAALGLNQTAFYLVKRGSYAEAEPLHRRARAIREKALGPDHPEVATSLNNLGLLLKAVGRHGEAEPLYRRALAIKEKALPPDHPLIATVLENYAALLESTGRDDEARELNNRAASIRAKRETV